MSKPAPDSIWLRPEPNGRRSELSRARIAAEALALADREGFAGLSMRQLAEQLDVGTMTLYHYVRTKEDLVALMDDALMEQLLLPPAQLRKGWRHGLTLIGRRTRDIFRQHPWALLSLRSVTPGPRAMEHFEQCLSVLEGSPFRDTQKLALLESLDSFIFGSALRAASPHRGDGLATDGAEDIRAAVQEELGKRLIATGRFPQVERVFGSMTPRARSKLFSPEQEEARFEAGLAALLDGLERAYR